MQLNQLWKNSLANKGTMQHPRKQKTNHPCKTCEDTEFPYLPTGQVITNDVGASGVEKFSLHDCPTCKGEKYIYSKD